jgi:hypothetical protein
MIHTPESLAAELDYRRERIAAIYEPMSSQKRWERHERHQRRRHLRQALGRSVRRAHARAATSG